MKSASKTHLVLLLVVLFAAGCSSNPPPGHDPYNPADSQKSNAEQAQDELSTEMDKNK